MPVLANFSAIFLWLKDSMHMQAKTRSAVPLAIKKDLLRMAFGSLNND